MAGIQQVRTVADDSVRWTQTASTTTVAAVAVATPGTTKSKTHPPPLRTSI